MPMLCPTCDAEISGDGCAACKPRGRKRLPLRSLSGPRAPTNWLLIGISLTVAVALTGGIVWFLSSTADEKLRRQGIFDDEVDIAPDKQFGYVIVARLSTHYLFEVQALDGPAVMAWGNVDDGPANQMTAQDVDSVLGSATNVDAGKTVAKTGEMNRGRFVWVVANPSKEKRLRVRIRFG